MKDFWRYQKQCIEDILWDAPTFVPAVFLLTLLVKFTWSLF